MNMRSAMEYLDLTRQARDAAQLAEEGAQTAEDGAQLAEANAQTAEDGAQLAETNAQTSETNAQTAEDGAQTAETNAQTSETNALLAEDGAQTAEDGAQTSETNAQASELKAEKWAEEDKNVEVETDKYSAKHWAAIAQDYAGSATDFVVHDNTWHTKNFLTDNENVIPIGNRFQLKYNSTEDSLDIEVI
jgi:uncharacterized phage infection (PIP) family protein YhgE